MANAQKKWLCGECGDDFDFKEEAEECCKEEITATSLDLTENYEPSDEETDDNDEDEPE